MEEFRIISNIDHIEVIATGKGVLIRKFLDKKYGKGNWRKLKGISLVELSDQTIANAEIHWFEAHGLGKVEFKIKRIIK